MNDKDLADTVVAKGVGFAVTDIHYALHNTNRVGIEMLPDDFVRDWRVAGALMEKVEAKGYDFVADVQAGKQAIIRTGRWSGERCSTENTKGIGTDESLPRAIIEACVEALT